MPATDSLSALLLDPARRGPFVDDAARMVDAEVAAVAGASGLIVKPAFAALKKSKPGFLNRMIDDALPGVVDALEPYYREAVASATPISAVFAAKPAEVSDALVRALDDHIEGSGRDGMKKGYGRFRNKVPEHVRATLPKLAALIEKYQA